MKDNIIFKKYEIDSLSKISDSLWNLMNEEIEKNGHSDLTLALEGFSLSIHEIIYSKREEIQ